ncbi:MAG: BON domain-containing protein [Proteobacteria bacterium]|nr:BON domain-containing protein [Pseudomonadota bacterium]
MRMNKGYLIRNLRLVGGLTLGMGVASLRLNAEDSANKPIKSDNSQMNAGDTASTAVTADHQSSAKGDTEVVRKIRASLTEDKSLSTYAQNVKIISANGHVTLKGPVRSAQEKATVELAATRVAGAKQVRSELELSRQ